MSRGSEIVTYKVDGLVRDVTKNSSNFKFLREVIMICYVWLCSIDEQYFIFYILIVNKMYNSVHELICSLMETAFFGRKDAERRKFSALHYLNLFQ